MTADAAFWDKIAPKYAKQPISNVPADEATLTRVRAHLKASDRAIEFGAGTGSTALLLAPSVDRYLGTDISDGMMEIAEEKRQAEGVPSLRFAVGEVRDFSAEDVTVALAFNLFHLVPDMEGDFRRIFDMLPSGGLFIQKTPALAKRWYLKFLIAPMKLFGKAPSRVRFISIDGLDHAVEAAGFEIIETGLYPPSAPSRFIVARKP